MSGLEAIDYGLTVHSSEAWHLTVDSIRANLDRERRMALAIAALAACEPDDLDDILSELTGGAGAPVPPFDGVMSEANFWADLASRDELKAYSAAAYSRLSARDQSAFQAWAGGRVAA